MGLFRSEGTRVNVPFLQFSGILVQQPSTHIMSNDVCWAVTRNNSAFLLKKRNCPKPFSTDPMCLTNVHSHRYSGVCNSKAIGIKAAPEGSFEVTLKKAKSGNRPAASLDKMVIRGGKKRSVPTLKRMLHGRRYRKDLASAALKRATAICRSQKPKAAATKKKAAKKE